MKYHVIVRRADPFLKPQLGYCMDIYDGNWNQLGCSYHKDEQSCRKWANKTRSDLQRKGKLVHVVKQNLCNV